MPPPSLPPEDDDFDPLSAPTLLMRHSAPGELPPIGQSERPAAEPPDRRWPRRALWLVMLALLVIGPLWWFAPSRSPVDEAPMPATSAPIPVVVPPPAPAAASEPAASAVPVAVAQPSPASAPEQRKRVPAPVNRKQALQTPAPAPFPVAASALEPAAAPVALPEPPPSVSAASAPPRPKAVTELCSDSSLLTRSYCEYRECGEPGRANDPVCVRLKQAESARRVRP